MRVAMSILPAALGRALLLVALALSPGAAQQLVPRLTHYLAPPYDTPATQRFAAGDVSPVVHKWYGPRHLAETYARPWYATDTFYARQQYHRYLDQQLEGDEWYDSFGAAVGRGWLVYSWQQMQKERYGSRLLEGSSVYGRTNAYSAYFRNLVIASDTRGSASVRLMAGERIHTVFTPLTLNKPGYDGLRLDYAGNRLQGTLLLSRIGAPDAGERTNSAQLWGGHLTFAAASPLSVGLTYVNAHTVQTELGFTAADPVSGALTTAQHQPLETLWIRLADDSPEDLRDGAALFRYDLILQHRDGRAWPASSLGILPRVEGGRDEDGALVADGNETILLEYDLTQLRSSELTSADLRRALVELTVANDYRVDLSSNLQTDGQLSQPTAVFFTAARANGNGGDYSNTRQVLVDYGLPTANGLLGLDWNLAPWHGLAAQGEVVFNRQYLRYPGTGGNANYLDRRQAPAAYLQALYERFPFDVFVEAFSVHHAYSTSYFLPQSTGSVRYAADVPDLYEMVEDDDDGDLVPEWPRPFQLSSELVAWPGYDENGDLIHDHNQNGNLVPDYEEPFLHFRSDRPEFLFGPDMNHNGTVDRFENDLLPDYPYRTDHHGYNTYVRAHFGPDASLLAGRQRVFQRQTDRRTRAHYVLGQADLLLRRDARLRAYAFAARVRDTIADDLQLWEQPIGGAGRMRDVPDLLPGRNAWRHTLYADLDHGPLAGADLFHRAKWDWWVQRDPGVALRAEGLRRHSGFLGLVDRAAWRLPVGRGLLEPRCKSEWRHTRPVDRAVPACTAAEQTLILLWTQPLLAESVRANYFARYGRQIFDTQLQAGMDLRRTWMLQGRLDDLDQHATTFVWSVQLTNRTAYQGYQVVTRLGFQSTRRYLQRDPDQRASLFHLTMHAGLE